MNKSKSQNCKLKIENDGMMTFAFLIQSKRLWDHEMNVNFHFFISRQNYTFSVLSYVGFQTTMMAKTMMWVELHILNWCCYGEREITFGLKSRKDNRGKIEISHQTIRSKIQTALVKYYLTKKWFAMTLLVDDMN